MALDWRYSHRLYLYVPLALMFGLSGGVNLMGKEAWWQELLGALLLVSTVVTTAMLVRWLLLPVDPMSQERLHQYYEEMRFRNLWCEAKALYAGWRARRTARAD